MSSKATRSTPKHINREISWLSFNGRVLQEAGDPSVPLVERLRFLGIFSNNLDEFFRVRVATLQRMLELGKHAKAFIGDSPKKVLAEIQEKVLEQQREFAKHYHQILSELQKENIFLVRESNLSEEQSAVVHTYFDQKVRPNLIPILLQEGRPFPYLRDRTIYLAIRMTGLEDAPTQYAIAEVPTDILPRFFQLPNEGRKRSIILLDEVIRHCLDDLFPIFKFPTIEAWTIKVTRDAELDMDDDISKSFMEKMQRSVSNRQQGDPVRFIYDAGLPEDFYALITNRLEMDVHDHIIPGGRYHNFKDFIGFPNVGRAALEHKPIKPLRHPALDREATPFDAIAKQDILLHFPYQTFAHFVDFLRVASIDPAVVSIKITVYRLASISKVVNALISAAHNGKKVKAVIELRARFDEEANIHWSKQLEAAGVRVVFGVPGLKVHSKLCVVTRLENNKKVQYAAISTGNFNESTARIYTDDMLFTANRALTSETNKVFKFFDNNYLVPKFKHFIVSPWMMRAKFLRLIQQEINNKKAGKEAWIVWKLNNLVDFDIIQKLYAASKAGVKIQLIVRGVCSLKAGVENLSENIEAVSIVDKFLEHSRIYVFANGGKRNMYISSADLMARNIDYRVEVTAPVLDAAIQEELWEMLQIQLSDNVKARLLTADQSNAYKKTKGQKVRAQIKYYEYLASLHK